RGCELLRCEIVGGRLSGAVPETIARTRVELTLLPEASEAVTVTGYTPGLPYAWLTELPLAWDPSPKSQRIETADCVSVAAALIATGVSTCALAGTATAPKAGGVPSRSLTNSRSFKVPDRSLAPQATTARPLAPTAAAAV